MKTNPGPLHLLYLTLDLQTVKHTKERELSGSGVVELIWRYLDDRADAEELLASYKLLSPDAFLGPPRATLSSSHKNPSMAFRDWLHYAKENPEQLLDSAIYSLGQIEKSKRGVLDVEAPPASDEALVGYHALLFSYLHWAALTALVLEAKLGPTEDVRDLWGNVLRAALKLLPPLEPGNNLPAFPINGIISILGVASIAGLEFYRLRYAEGKYEEALHLLAKVFLALENAIHYAMLSQGNTEGRIPASVFLRGKQQRKDKHIEAPHLAERDITDLANLIRDAVKQDPSSFFGINPENFWGPEVVQLLDMEYHWRDDFLYVVSTIPIPLQESVELFEILCSTKEGVDWRQVAQDCYTLAVSGNLVLTHLDAHHKVFRGSDEWELTWSEFWHLAQGRAEGQMTPSALRELYDQIEDEKAQKVLVTHFIPENLWYRLPGQARRSLVDAERRWLYSRMGRVEGVANDLKLATESLCHSLIWEGLRKFRGDQPFLELVKDAPSFRRFGSVETSGRQPVLADYAWMCNQQSFKDWLSSLGLDYKDQRILIEELPNALIELNRQRNPAEHSSKWFMPRREKIEPVFNQFMGIGRESIIKRLIEIQIKINAKAPQTEK